MVFLGTHVFVSLRDARADVIARVGLNGYRALFALVSLVGLALIVWGYAQYRAHDWIQVWSPPAFMRHITVGLMLFAVIFVTAAFIPSHIKARLKHPMLAGVKTWALAHLLSNGDLGSILLFGTFLAWGVYARIAAKRRGDLGAAVAPAGWTNDIIVVVLGIVSLSRARLRLPSDRDRRAGVREVTAMSVQDEIRRLTAPDILARKGGEPIVCLTSYHAHTARLVDKYCDVILVGDSLGMVMHGLETTVPVTLEMMILQGHAVMRGSKRALVVVDMPFGSYEASKEQAFMNAARVLKETGCGAIKVEGGKRMAETIAFLVERGVPVMAHVGLTPQSINTIGSFRAQGRDEADWARIEEDTDCGVAGRRLLGGDRGGGRAAGAQAHRRGADPDHRHRRERGLRRADPGAGRHARPVAAGAEIRQALRRCSAPASRRRSPTMPPRCARAPFPAPSTSMR